MSRICYVCQKRPSPGNRVSNANNRTKRWVLPNLQRIHIEERGRRIRVRVCARCIKTGAVRKAS